MTCIAATGGAVTYHQNYTLSIVDMLSSIPVTTARDDVAYSYQAISREPVTSWAVSGASWLSIDANGLVTGTPPVSAAGQHQIKVSIWTTNGEVLARSNQQYTLNVLPNAAYAITSEPVTNTTANITNSYQVTSRYTVTSWYLEGPGWLYVSSSDRDQWHSAARRFMASASIGQNSASKYRYSLERSGQFLGYPAPKSVTLAQLRQLERTYPGGESFKAVQFSLLRAMLIYSGCRAARSWTFPQRVRAKTDGIFLSEMEVGTIRQYAKARGLITELIYSLGVDNGLRRIDMKWLTMQNAMELSQVKSSTILGKGRGGGNPGHLELSKMTERPLAEYLKMLQGWAERWGDCDSLLVIPGPRGLRSVSVEWIGDRIEALSDEAGIHFRPHDLRRTYGHRHHEAGRR